VIAGVVGLLGLLIGSFLNVVICRVPAGESVVRPGSRCPVCRNELLRRDNVPVLSWIVLGGKCRSCRTPIPVRYPAVEALTAVLFASAALTLSLHALAPALWFLALAVPLAVIDIDTMRLPSVLIWIGFGGVLIMWALTPRSHPKNLIVFGLPYVALACVGAAVAAGVMGAIYLLSNGRMGFGDVRLALLTGAFVGPFGISHVGISLFAAFVLASVFGIAMRQRKIPFGPFMLAGAFIAAIWGDSLWNAYMRLFPR
jgi:leader peptidase (prepilin peptidase) / N-methyltransferase